MLQLQIRPVDRRPHVGAQILVLDVSHNADDGRVGFIPFSDDAAHGVSRRTIESLGKGPDSPRPPWAALAHPLK
jgi:hypothetical protein